MHTARWAAVAVLATGIGFLFLGGVAGSDSSITVTQGDFELTCPTGAIGEGDTLPCTLKNTAAEAKPWPVVAILHVSTDADRALVRGTSIDVTLGAPSPSAAIDGGVTWIGDTLVGYSRFDWSGNAGADPTQTTVPEGAPGNSRTVNIAATNDGLDEDSEKFYVALGPDGSKGVGLLYNNKTSVTLIDGDSPSTDASLSSFELSAGQSRALSTTQATQSQIVAYEVTEATLTAAAARGTTMTMSASFGGSSLDLDGRGGTSIEVIDGQESAAVRLAVGTTTVTLSVTAEDGTTTGIHTVNIVRSALADGVDTVAVSLPSFTLTCPAEVAKAADAQCTLRASGSTGWPVVAVIHSSADGAARALVGEDPIIPDTDPNYSKDVSLGEQQPERTAFNYGYGELFSGGSRTLYRTYGYEKFDWTGSASTGDTRTVTIQIHDSDVGTGVAAEIFYVALAPTGYTGFSQLVDNKVPVLIKSPMSVTGVAAQDITPNSAEIEIEARNPAGMLYLRYRAGTSGAWTGTEEEMTSSPRQVSISGLTADTQYQVQASFDEDFFTGVMSGTFTTLTPSVPTVTGVEVASWAGQDNWYEFGKVISLRVAFSEAVVVTGSPTLGIDMDPADWGRKDAVYASGSGTDELMFTHEVVWPNFSAQGIAVLADTLALNGGTIQSASGGVDADLAHSGLDHDAAHRVDWQRTTPVAEISMEMECAPAQGGAYLRWAVPEPPAGPMGNPVIASRMIAGRCTMISPPNARVSWSLSGADAARFEFSDDGTLSFAGLAPDFEAPSDSNGDNVYEVTISATMGDQTLPVNVAIAVTDAYEAPTTIVELPPPPASAEPVMAMVNGNELTLVFTNEIAAIDDATARTLRQYFVVDGGRDAHGNAVDGQSPIQVAVESNLLTLTLAAPIAPGDDATISYYGGLNNINGTPLETFSSTFTTTEQG